MLLTGLSRTTLTTFHRDVYRPRMALLLLVLLLIVAQQDHQQTVRQAATQQDHQFVTLRDGRLRFLDSTSIHSQSGRLARQIEPLLARLPDSLRLDQSTVAVRWIKSQGDKGTVGRKPSDIDRDSIEAARALAAKAASRRSAESKAKGKPVRKDDVKQAAKERRERAVSRSLLVKILNADALATIVALHSLWAVRIGAMLLDDVLDKDLLFTSTSSQAIGSNGFVCMWLLASVVLACMASTMSWAETFSRWGIAQRAEPGALSWSIPAILILELSATLVSLLPLTHRLRRPDQEHILPRKASLPSPSHSPALVDLLPIPPGLANVLRGRDMPMDRRSMRSRHRMAAYWSAPSMHSRRMIAAPVPPMQGPIDAPAAATTAVRPTALPAQRPTPTSSTGLPEPLRMSTSGKAPRLRGMHVNVDMTWLLENVVVLYGHIVGAMQYAIVMFALPSFAPTSFPSLLSAVSARSELCAMVATWSSARRSAECLEFVRRRWGGEAAAQAPREASSAAKLDAAPCPICFESVERVTQPGNRTDGNDSDNESLDEDFCRLDCGHQLHAVCLVQWLTKQAFCPCCHATLKATPPHLTATGPLTTAGGGGGVPAAP